MRVINREYKIITHNGLEYLIPSFVDGRVSIFKILREDENGDLIFIYLGREMKAIRVRKKVEKQKDNERVKMETLTRIRFKLFYQTPILFLVLLLILSSFIFYAISTYDRDISNLFYIYVTIIYVIIFTGLWASMGNTFDLNDAELYFIEKNDFLSKEFNQALNKKGTKLSLRFLFALNKEIKGFLLNMEKVKKNNEIEKIYGIKQVGK